MVKCDNLLTDVAGISVGNAHDTALMSGVTAILIAQPNTAASVTRGGAPGTRNATFLQPEMTGQGLDGIILSGGSAYGLDASGGAMSVLRARGIGLEIGPIRVPLVSQAIVFDLLNGGAKNWGDAPVYWTLGKRATEAASTDAFALGSIGGGFGCTTPNLRGGLGSASSVTASGFTVAALALVNAVGMVTVGDSRYFWAAPCEVGAEFGGNGWPQPMPADALTLRMKGGVPPSTTIAVVGTDAVLSKTEVKRIAIMADDGLARAVRPAHAPMDGDTVFAVATSRRAIASNARATTIITEIGLAAADCLARAIARGVYEAAPTPVHWVGPPAYCQHFSPGPTDCRDAASSLLPLPS